MPARLELFLEGGYGGAWSGAQAEEHAHRLASFDRLRTRCACAGAGAERNAAECPTKKEHGFHLVLDGASEASAVASPRSSTGLTSPVQTRRIVALSPGELARLAGMLVSTGFEGFPCTTLDAGGFAAGDVLPRCCEIEPPTWAWGVPEDAPSGESFPPALHVTSVTDTRAAIRGKCELHDGEDPVLLQSLLKFNAGI